MKPPFVKFIRLELMTLSLVVVIGMISLIKKVTFLLLFSLLLLGGSLFFEGLTHYYTYQPMEAVKQIVKAVMVFLFTAYLLFAI